MKSGLMIASMAAVLALTGASTASAGDGQRRGWTTISGSGVPSDCGGADFALELSGNLEGCWVVFPETFTCEELNGFAWYTEAGRETFDGTLNGEPGSFVTTYTFEAAYAPGLCSTFDFNTELAGGCDHNVKGKSGSFTGVVGRIQYVDVIPAGVALYVGQLNRDRP